MQTLKDYDWQALYQSICELKEVQKETGKQMKQTDKKIKELGKQIGGIGEKFGYFTEGLALPSMKKILRNQFKMEVISPGVIVKNKNGQEREIDVLAYANADINTVIVVEIKSKLREEGILQIKNTLQEFFHFFPEHKGKKLLGIIAAIDVKPHRLIKQKILEEGLYYAEINNDIFRLKVPKNFKAKVWEG